MAIVHFQCFNNEAIGNYIYMYYDLLETVIDENDLWYIPGQLYSVVEPELPLDPAKLWVCAKNGCKQGVTTWER